MTLKNLKWIISDTNFFEREFLSVSKSGLYFYFCTFREVIQLAKAVESPIFFSQKHPFTLHEQVNHGWLLIYWPVAVYEQVYHGWLLIYWPVAVYEQVYHGWLCVGEVRVFRYRRWFGTQTYHSWKADIINNKSNI